MSYLLRLTPPTKSGDTELLQSQLWNAGTTGTSELPSGEIIAGFEDEATAQQTGLTIEAKTVGQPWTFVVEKVTPETWEPYTKETSIRVPAPSGLVMFEIEAGQVFGHGKHPTTRLMIELLARTVSSGVRVLDVGTGSGVLGIVAAKLGAQVEAIDIDDDAVAVALENARRNNVEIECSTTPLSEVVTRSGQGFDVVVINVLLPVHAQLYQDVRQAVSPGGQILLAGFLDNQESSIHQLYQPFELVDRSQIDDWVGIAVLPNVAKSNG